MSYKRYCINCGKETEKLIDNLCENCYKKLKKSKKTIKRIKICKKCGKLFYKNKEISEEKLYEISKEGEIKKEYFLCEKCKKIYSKKYNTIIQIRNLIDNRLDILLNFLNKENIPIKKIEQINENSLDIYVLLERISLKKCIKFFKKNNFNIKITRKLKTYDAQHSRKVYILTILVR